MIRLNYSGGLGNKLWQYVCSRIYAEKHGLYFKTTPIEYFPNVSKCVSGRVNLFPRRVVEGHFLPEFEDGVRYLFRGQFERFEYLVGNEDRARQWATPLQTRNDNPEKDDLVISIRRGWRNWPAHELCPSIEFYDRLLSLFSYKRLFVCTDSPEDTYFQEFKKHINFEIYRGSAVDQFNFIRKSNRYIMAPSTFSFWSSFVGQASEVYWPNIWALENDDTDYDWFPYTDKRYVRVFV